VYIHLVYALFISDSHGQLQPVHTDSPSIDVRFLHSTNYNNTISKFLLSPPPARRIPLTPQHRHATKRLPRFPPPAQPYILPQPIRSPLRIYFRLPFTSPPNNGIHHPLRPGPDPHRAPPTPITTSHKASAHPPHHHHRSHKSQETYQTALLSRF
jgi:hypothetical protein